MVKLWNPLSYTFANFRIFTWCGHYPAVLIVITSNCRKPQNQEVWPVWKKPGLNPKNLGLTPKAQTPIKPTGFGFLKTVFSTVVYGNYLSKKVSTEESAGLIRGILMLVGMDPVSSISLGSRTSISLMFPLSRRWINSSSCTTILCVWPVPPASASVSLVDAA